MSSEKTTDVVVILPYLNNKILLQLRDFKYNIVHPGRWGFFGGSINKGELPDVAALRELFEEISYRPPRIFFLGCFPIPTENNKHAYIYYCPLDVPLQYLKLGEGVDFGLFKWAEIFTERLYSQKMGCHFPVVNTPFVLNTIQRVLSIVSRD